MFEFLTALGLIWLSSQLTHRYLLPEADTLSALLVGFAFALLGPVIHLFLSVFAAAIFSTAFSPENWLGQTPMVALTSGLIAFITVRTRPRSAKPDEGHIEKKF